MWVNRDISIELFHYNPALHNSSLFEWYTIWNSTWFWRTKDLRSRTTRIDMCNIHSTICMHISSIKLFEASEPERNKGRIWLKTTVWLVGKSQWNRTFEAYNCVHPHSKIGILSALKRRWYGLSLWNNCPHVFHLKKSLMPDFTINYALFNINEAYTNHGCIEIGMNVDWWVPNSTFVHRHTHIHVDYTSNGLIVRDK